MSTHPFTPGDLVRFTKSQTGKVWQVWAVHSRDDYHWCEVALEESGELLAARNHVNAGRLTKVEEQ